MELSSLEEHQTIPNTNHELQLTQEEAENLAKELKLQLQLGKIHKADAQQIKLMIAGLGDSRGLLRRTFVESLGKIGDDAIPGLEKALLKSQNVTVRRAAAKTLRLVGNPNALPALLEALINDPDPVVQGSSVGAMAVFGEKAVLALLKVLINPKSTALQCGLASWGLAFIGAKAPKELKNAAKSKNPRIRAAAIGALEDQIQSLNDIEAKKLLLDALYDQSAEVRAEATILLGKIHDPNLVKPLLIERLSDSDSDVRKKASLSLMKLKDPDSIYALKERASKEKDPLVMAVLKLAIKKTPMKKNNSSKS